MVSVFVLSNLRGKREERERENARRSTREPSFFSSPPLSLSSHQKLKKTQGNAHGRAGGGPDYDDDDFFAPDAVQGSSSSSGGAGGGSSNSKSVQQQQQASSLHRPSPPGSPSPGSPLTYSPQVAMEPLPTGPAPEFAGGWGYAGVPGAAGGGAGGAAGGGAPA